MLLWTQIQNKQNDSELPNNENPKGATRSIHHTFIYYSNILAFPSIWKASTNFAPIIPNKSLKEH